MTAERFDNLTKSLSQTSTRRSVLKRIGAASVVALGGAFALTRGGHGNAAEAATAQACARLGQCVGGRFGAACCPGLTLDGDTCKRPVGGACYESDDCQCFASCCDNPHGSGKVCSVDL